MLKKAIDTTLCAIKELIGNEQVAWRDMRTQTAYSADGDHPFDAQALESPDVCSHWQIARRDTVTASMPWQKGHGDPLNETNRQHIAGPAKGRVDLDLCNLAHALHTIEPAPANNTYLCLWHKKLFRLSPEIENLLCGSCLLRAALPSPYYISSAKRAFCPAAC
jgi:hypothetical protein